MHQVTYRDCEIIASSQLRNLTNTTERRTHDDGLVSKLLVVVEDALHALDTGILIGGIGLAGGGLVPVENAADEWGDEEGTCFSGSNSLNEREHESQIAVDAVLGLQDLGGFDAFPGRGDLDQDALLANAQLLVELYDD